MTVQNEITRLAGAKADLKTAIEAKGVTVPEEAGLESYPALVEQISTGIESLDESTPTTLNGILKGNGTSLGVAVAGVDYVATESDPTVPSWAKAENKPTYTAAEVGAEATGAVATHNAAGDAHASLFEAKADLVDGKVPASQLPQGGGGSNVVVGTYVGNAASSSETPQTINLGGQPLFVWVGSLDNYVSNDPGVPWYEDTYFYEGGTEEESLKRLYSAYAYWGDPYYWVNSAGELSAVLEITSTGFDVYNYDYVNEGTSRYKTYRARLNMNNDVYFYLAVMEG